MKLLSLAALVGFATITMATSPLHAASMCTSQTTNGTTTEVDCPYQRATYTFNLIDNRYALYQLPNGTPPAGGWPVVFIFQGTTVPPDPAMWQADSSASYGGLYGVEIVQQLLDNGYAVITPEADLNGFNWMATNIPPLTNLGWPNSADQQFMNTLYADIDNGVYGELNGTKTYSVGISGGGYMASRVALSYPDRVRALVIESSSYAWCEAEICEIPVLPANHAPTLFMHGGADTTVPISTAEAYYAALLATGVETQFIEDPTLGHQWLPEAPVATLSWISLHP